jgi:hypothetical protein
MGISSQHFQELDKFVAALSSFRVVSCDATDNWLLTTGYYIVFDKVHLYSI